MDSITHILSPYSASWVAWLLFGLLIVMMANRSSRTNLALIIQSVFSRAERSYSFQTHSWVNRILTGLYEWGVMGLAVYLFIYNGGSFDSISYLQILGVVAAVYLVQGVSIMAVGHVFLSSKNYANTNEQYRSIRSLMCLLCYPILVIGINIPNAMVVKITLCVLLLLFTVVLMSKLLIIFYKNIWSLVYILLYIVYLELIPIATIIVWGQQIVQ